MKTKDTTIALFQESIKSKRYQKATVVNYSNCIKDLINYYEDVRPSKITQAQIKAYLNLRIDQGISSSYQNIYINAFNLWWQKSYNRKGIQFNNLRPKKRKKLQKVLTVAEVQKGFSKIKNPKHKAICAMMYFCGLRVGEVINFELSWFNKESKEMHVAGKGAKDRIIPYSLELRSILHSYFNDLSKNKKPLKYLFKGQTKEKYSPASIRKITHRFFNINPHGLRHAFAVHMYKSGVDIYTIKEWLGHDDIRTTEVYIKLDCSDLAESADVITLKAA